MKVGIYAGSFDPIHNGHVAFAIEAAKAASLQQIFFLPDKKPWRKDAKASFEHRMAMIQEAIQDMPTLNLLCFQNDEQYTATKTLPALQHHFTGAELWFLLGSDVFLGLSPETWPNLKLLVRSVKFVVGLREHSVGDVEAKAKELKALLKVNVGYLVVETDHTATSSRHMRGNNQTDLAPAVQKYMQQHRLYS